MTELEEEISFSKCFCFYTLSQCEKALVKLFPFCNMKQEYSKIYRELRPEKTGSLFDLEDPLCWRFKTTHILIASQAKTSSIYPHQWDSGARTGARPGLRESIPALPLFILPRVIYGTSRMTVRLLTVFLLLQTISQMLTYIPSMFHMGSGLQDQLSTQSATDIYLW